MDRVARRVLRRGLCLKRGHIQDVTAANVRKTFIEYFQRDHKHVMIPSSPVEPKRDPTVSFVVAGMNQFKDVFLGKEVPASRRVVNSQKCIRIAGKHNDLSQVGLDGTHHTFFEMLGNWSFGDYFKKEACVMAWKLLTEVYGLPAERLYVTYFKGDESLGLPPDLETREIWREIGIPEKKILPFGMRDNFWEMGSLGPCGPATEIHYDHIPGRQEASELVNSGDPLVTELWNIVFIEFERKENGDLRCLGDTFVDTGMGFERLVAILQGQTSNYETDLFRPLFEVMEGLSGQRGYRSTYEGDIIDCSYRMLADHVRMLTVALADGMAPFNHYRLRLMFRKVFALQRDIFNGKKGLAKELSNCVAEMLSPAYPEIGRNIERVRWVFDLEEDSFIQRNEKSQRDWQAFIKNVPKLASIDSDLKEEFMIGYKYLDDRFRSGHERKISGKLAYKLYDTYGMSLDGIKKLGAVFGATFNEEEFQEYSSYQTKEARVSTQKMLAKQNEPSAEIPAEVGLTDDSLKYEYSVDITTGNYDLPEVPVRVMYALLNGKVVDRVTKDDVKGGDRELALVLDKTAMFHETDELSSDKGVLALDDVTFRIYKVVKVDNRLIHYAYFESVPESYEFGNKTGILRVSGKERRALMRANTAALLVTSLLYSQKEFITEKRTVVEPDSCRIELMGYSLSSLGTESLQIEKDIGDVLNTAETIDREWCSIEEIGEMYNLLRKAGETFIKEKTPIATVRAPWMTARFKCHGPLVRYLSEVEHFAVINVETAAYRVKALHCVTGPKAAQVKENNASAAEEWKDMRNFHIISGVYAETINERLNLVKAFLRKICRPGFVSYYIRSTIEEEAMMKMSRLEKGTRKMRGLSRRN